MHVLVTSAGRRVALVRAFQAALAGAGQVVAADVDRTAPALYAADAGVLVPPVTDPDYVDRLLDVVLAHQIRAVVPTIDPELPVLAAARPRLAAAGAEVLVMDPPAVAIAADKLATAELVARLGLGAPRTLLPPPDRELPLDLSLPVVVKPRHGSASQGVQICHTRAALVRALCGGDLVVQECLSGPEVTVDILGDLNGQVLAAVPRQRLKVRAGEVERGITIAAPALLNQAVIIAGALRPRGAINLQCFLTPDGPRFTEVNARFGGGYPLTQAAGVDFAALLCRCLRGEAIAPCLGAYQAGVLMLRFDDAVVLRAADLLPEQGAPGAAGGDCSDANGWPTGKEDGR